jgi:aerobic-type carbon monoxide dehydrogenase small subunit (CoxS/CutS family)
MFSAKIVENGNGGVHGEYQRLIPFHRCRSGHAVVVGDPRRLGLPAPNNVAQCGACTVHIDGHSLRSCSLPVSAVGNREITTVERLQSREGKAVQAAWASIDVPQCGGSRQGDRLAALHELPPGGQPTDPVGRDAAAPTAGTVVEALIVSIQRNADALMTQLIDETGIQITPRLARRAGDAYRACGARVGILPP